MLIKKKQQKKNRLKTFLDTKNFIQYSNDMDDIYKNIGEYNPNKKRKILIVVDDMIVDMLNNKEFNPIVTKLFISGTKVNISLIFIIQSYIAVPKNIRLNSTHFFITKIPDKEKIQWIVTYHSTDFKSKELMHLNKNCTRKPYYFLVIYITPTSGIPLDFRNNFLERT